MLNVLIVGVGGQGSLLASRILGSLFMDQGLDVKMSEVHGMAQRGGSVVTFVRAGESVASPLVSPGEADLIISFEELEAARYLPYLRRDGTLIVNTQRIAPMPVITGAAKYPEGILAAIRGKGVRVVAFDALHAALRAGSAKAANVALLGAASRVIGYDKESWERAMNKTVPSKFIKLNLAAFENGYNS